jgi:ribose transport system substrate-binding protein
VANLLQTYGKEINAVYGHSDDDCIGAIQAIKSYGLKPGEDILLVGIDGCSDGMYAIIAGEYYKSVQCSPIFGPIAFDTAEKYFAGEKIPTYIQMPGKLIDKSNVDVILATEGY